MTYPNITGGDDHRREAFEAMTRAAVLNGGGTLSKSDTITAADFRGEHWHTWARRCLDWAGVSHRGMDNGAAVTRAWDEGVRSGATTATLPGLVANAFSLRVVTAYRNTVNIARRLCRAIPLPDFRRANHVIFDGPATLAPVPEGALFQSSGLSDRLEYLRPASYGLNVDFSRAAALAGQIGEAVKLAELAAKAAANTEDAVLFDLLLENSQTGPTLNADSTTLFHADHGNYVTSGAAPSVATLAVGVATMRKQTDAQGVRAQNIAPKFLVCPAALEVSARVLVASLYNAAAADDIEVIAAAQLDGTNGNGWYLFADPKLADTFGLSFLGEPTATEPVPEVYTPEGMGWARDALTFKVRHAVGVTALDFRGMFYNDGA